MSIKKVRSHISPNEALLFERSSPGKKAYQLPELDVPRVDPRAALGAQNVRTGIEGFPEVSEVEAIRHFTRLSTWNYAIDHGMYPLGSCTMKYNPRVNELVARTEGGQEVVTLTNSPQSAGYYAATWNGRNNFGLQVSSGVYFYRFEARSVSGHTFASLKKMLFLK